MPPSTESIRPASATTQRSLFNVSFGQSFFLLGGQANNYQRQINIVDNVATSVGSHQFGFGIDYRRLAPISGVHEYDFSTFFNGINAAIAGQAAQVGVTTNFGRMYPVFTNFSAYAQDTWRMNQRLTLTYGVRWELNPPPHEAKGNDPFTVQGLDQPATATLAPRGTPLWQTTYGNFAPRVGMAYLLNSKRGRETVLRGGFGIFYDLGNGPGSQAIFGANYPNTATKVLNNIQFPLTQTQLAPPAFSADPPYATLYITDPHSVLPRTYEWNFAIERSLGNTQTISASYVGAAGRRLLRRELLHPNALFTDLHRILSSRPQLTGLALTPCRPCAFKAISLALTRIQVRFSPSFRLLWVTGFWTCLTTIHRPNARCSSICATRCRVAVRTVVPR